jgi:hypothetical protein
LNAVIVFSLNRRPRYFEAGAFGLV